MRRGNSRSVRRGPSGIRAVLEVRGRPRVCEAASQIAEGSPIGPQSILWLREHRLRAKRTESDDLLFGNRNGQPLRESKLLQNVLQPAAKAAGRSPRWGFAVGVFPILYSATVSVLISAMPTEPRFESPSALMLVFLVVLWMMEMLAIVGHIYIAIGIRRTFDTSDALLVAMIIVPFVGYAVVGFGATTHRPPPIDPDEQTPTATGS